jgi:hypothetical protein
VVGLYFSDLHWPQDGLLAVQRVIACVAGTLGGPSCDTSALLHDHSDTLLLLFASVGGLSFCVSSSHPVFWYSPPSLLRCTIAVFGSECVWHVVV